MTSFVTTLLRTNKKRKGDYLLSKLQRSWMFACVESFRGCCWSCCAWLIMAFATLNAREIRKGPSEFGGSYNLIGCLHEPTSNPKGASTKSHKKVLLIPSSDIQNYKQTKAPNRRTFPACNDILTPTTGILRYLNKGHEYCVSCALLKSMGPTIIFIFIFVYCKDL